MMKETRWRWNWASENRSLESTSYRAALCPASIIKPDDFRQSQTVITTAWFSISYYNILFIGINEICPKKKRSHFSKFIFLCNWSLIKWIWHTVTWHTVRTIIIIKFKLPGLFFFQSVSGPVLCEAPVGGVAGFYDPVCRRWHPGL